jgi:hypothetical protein
MKYLKHCQTISNAEHLKIIDPPTPTDVVKKYFWDLEELISAISRIVNRDEKRERKYFFEKVSTFITTMYMRIE